MLVMIVKNGSLCRSCHNAMCRNNVSVQAEVDGLELARIPNELKDLNTLELQMISLRIPFMKLLALPSGKQCCIHGPAVNVPLKLDSVCTLLPRLPNEASMIPLKLKQKIHFKGHYMFDYVRPNKVMMALKWLKANNPLYSSLDTNDEWVNNANTEFFRGDHSDVDHDCGDFSIKVCEDFASSDLMTILCKNAKNRGFVIHDLPGDNNCFFHTVLYMYQLPNIGIQSIDPKTLRSMVVDYLRANPTVNGIHYCNFINDEGCSVMGKHGKHF